MPFDFLFLGAVFDLLPEDFLLEPARRDDLLLAGPLALPPAFAFLAALVLACFLALTFLSPFFFLASTLAFALVQPLVFLLAPAFFLILSFVDFLPFAFMAFLAAFLGFLAFFLGFFAFFLGFFGFFAYFFFACLSGTFLARWSSA